MFIFICCYTKCLDVKCVRYKINVILIYFTRSDEANRRERFGTVINNRRLIKIRL